MFSTIILPSIVRDRQNTYNWTTAEVRIANIENEEIIKKNTDHGRSR